MDGFDNLQVGRRSAAAPVRRVRLLEKSRKLALEEATAVVNKSTLLAGLACISLSLFSCTTTYRESKLPDEPLDESTTEAPNCSLLSDEAGCEAESPFDPRDDEEEF